MRTKRILQKDRLEEKQTSRLPNYLHLEYYSTDYANWEITDVSSKRKKDDKTVMSSDNKENLYKHYF